MKPLFKKIDMFCPRCKSRCVQDLTVGLWWCSDDSCDDSYYGDNQTLMDHLEGMEHVIHEEILNQLDIQ